MDFVKKLIGKRIFENLEAGDKWLLDRPAYLKYVENSYGAGPHFWIKVPFVLSKHGSGFCLTRCERLRDGHVLKIPEQDFYDIVSLSSDRYFCYYPTPAGYEYNMIEKSLDLIARDFLSGMSESSYNGMGYDYPAHEDRVGHEEFYTVCLVMYAYSLSMSFALKVKRSRVGGYILIPNRSLVKRGRKLGWRKPERVRSEAEKLEAESLWSWNRDVAVKRGNCLVFIEAYKDYCEAVGIGFKRAEAVRMFNEARKNLD